mmetsp:Transcript_30071/g.34956  ORF Transcript_30071/g.34956 Transcript_30071/m.34956 type:complete len:1067 (-) Transcript_30071:67-3267(-)
MDTATVSISIQPNVSSRGDPALATPSPPESCASVSSEHLHRNRYINNKADMHMQFQMHSNQQDMSVASSHNHSHNPLQVQVTPNVTSVNTQVMVQSTHDTHDNNSSILANHNPNDNSIVIYHQSSTPAHHHYHSDMKETSTSPPLPQSQPQHANVPNHSIQYTASAPQNTSDSETSPAVVGTVTSNATNTTAFPALPLCSKPPACHGNGNAGLNGNGPGGGDGGGNGGHMGSQRNKRPTRDRALRKLSDALMRRSLTMIDLSQRELRPSDATLIKLALLQNSSLSVLKLGYNNLCDEGVITLSSGISTHAALTSIDIGFNNVSDDGCVALSNAILASSRRGGKLHTLYLAGNNIGEVGARALAEVVRRGCGLKRIHLTNNSIGPIGIQELAKAVIDYEHRLSKDSGCGLSVSTSSKFTNQTLLPTQQQHQQLQQQIKVSMNGNRKDSIMNPTMSMKLPHCFNAGITDLFLGGTNIGHDGCIAIAQMFEQTTSLLVLSLANCELNDEEAIILAAAITKNCKKLPLEKLQLSFNNLSCKGIEALMNAVWGLTCLKDLSLDNNKMQARGAQVVAAVLGAVKTLHTLDVGFNSITGSGMKHLMKAVAESKTLNSLSISGNDIDPGSANAVAIALAHNKSLTSLFLDHCSISAEGQRLVTAGIVSNSNTCLQVLTGFRIGAYAKVLRLPDALSRWTNEQVLSFILFMWNNMRQEQEENLIDNEIDPLNLLPGVNGGSNSIRRRVIASGPLDAPTVVAVAKRAFETLGPKGEEMLAKSTAEARGSSFKSPLAGDVIVVEANGVAMPLENLDSSGDYGDVCTSTRPKPPIPGNLIVHKTTAPKVPSMDPDMRKKKIMEWLCKNMYHLNELSQLPFNDGELWRLHQHFVSPTIQETNLHHGESSSSPESSEELQLNSMNYQGCSLLSAPCAPLHTVDLSTAPASEPVMNTHSSKELKRTFSIIGKLSARGESTGTETDQSVTKLIKDMNGHSMQPKKRARRNHSRISIVPRIKKKLESFLITDHQRALGLMRQLAYVEKSLLNGSMYPVEDLDTATHLIGSLASDAEMILVDMM